jgi:serine/threonine protein kinase, bacterial
MPDGNLLVSDFSNRVFRARPGGPLAVVAGNGEPGHDGDGGPAVRARVGFPVEVARDPRGGFAIVSGERWIRRVGEDGVIRTIAELASPTALAFDAAGNLFVSELGGRIRRIDAGTGAVTTFAGVGGEGYGGDGGPAVAAQLNRPHGLAVAADGTVYVCDTFNNRIRRIGPDGIITTLATGVNSPDLELARDGSLYVADFGNNRIARVSLDGAVSTVASAAGPNAVAVDAAGLVYFTERGVGRIRRLDPSTGAVTTVLGR